MKHEYTALATVLKETRQYLALPENDFVWSSWEDSTVAMQDMDALIACVEAGDLPDRVSLASLYAPTGRIQEVSLSSGWGNEFIDLATRFDKAAKLAYRRWFDFF